MLEELYIKDFALIREVRVSFGPALNILTGETGAGKSILLGALHLALGGKATTDMIRSGQERAISEAVFRISGGEKDRLLRDKLEEHGLEADEDLVILRREITIEGKGRSFINARQVPVQLLKDVGRLLVDIHGQHEHQNIMQLEFHRQILDRYAGLGEKVKEVRRLYEEREKLVDQLQSVTLSAEEKNRRIALLEHEIKELSEARLVDSREFEELQNEEKSLSHAETVLNHIHECTQILMHEEEGVLKKIALLERILDHDAQLEVRLAPILEQIREAFYVLKDVAHGLRQRADEIRVDPERLSYVKERLDLLQKILRKYGPTIEDAQRYLEKAKRELAGIELSEEEEEKIRKKIEEINLELCQRCAELSQIRQKKARELEEKVAQELKYLGMEETKLRLSLKWDLDPSGIFFLKDNPEKRYRIYPHGLDQVEFLLASSANEVLRPLRKIASGGEMSRIMLALKKVIIDTDPVPTMIFDEVDTGVGGRIAEAIGERLASLAEKAQVLVVTHLHQIAGISSPETVHFKVVKDREEGSRIFRLNREERIQEVARMLSGSQITESALAYARKLIMANAS
ncbi:MAG: DNA repair protein RecN [Leptospiraceae bacterium]|nr:DNA repair protein RecN [Leptospiraceae bacterium]MDW8306202.1 DNA repair protein RecN [Leptospiraceae bacterium]